MKKFFCFIYLTCQMLPTSAQGILSLDSCRALAVANNKELLICLLYTSDAADEL